MTIESIKIKLTKDEAIELPLEAAKELYEGLHELFGKTGVLRCEPFGVPYKSSKDYTPFWTWYSSTSDSESPNVSYQVTYNQTLEPL